MKNGGAALIILVSTLFQASAFSESLPVTGEIIIFHAGSLSVPFRDIAAAFEKEYPDVQVLREAAGSRTCARKIADLERPCDIFASADYAVIDSLLIPEHAAWNIKFASNEMVIAYTKDSKAIQEITRDNWHRILLRSDIRFGRSEPNTDPCGYRTLLTLKLAEGFYDLPGLAQSFSKKDQRYIRPKETDLLALLETQSIDYVFIYRSVAEQHKLKWITLPDKINLKRPDFAKHYAAVSVGLSGTAPNT
ncbi:MAG: substrate-binding domain-containing protein, partial [Candidatus Hydrogenedentes bacterium]|nr:substrate-binding domain-containing protein [Candidatus Hydrogenedentota bacterium]